MRQFLTQGAKTGDGHSIIDISAGATQDIDMTMSPCIASKCAVEGLTETALLEYARQDMHINVLLRGVFETEKSGPWMQRCRRY
jgi:NAD(P)-dependent dehydrogenase (short-subunit alcohol dehydrogenase family)